MAYRVMVGSVTVLCDTADDALEIIRRLDGAPVSRVRAAEPTDGASRWTPSRVAEFLRHVNDNQRKVLDTLMTYAEGRTDEQLIQMLGVNNGRFLAGVLAGLYKNGKKVGADPDDLYTKRWIAVGKKKMREYTLTPSFRKAMESR